MQYYRAQQVQGDISSFVKADEIYISNKDNETPFINFSEYKKTTLPDGGEISQQVSTLTQMFDSPETTFDLINPVDGSVLGSATHQEFYVMLFSLYMDLANKRDAQNTPSA